MQNDNFCLIDYDFNASIDAFLSTGNWSRRLPDFELDFWLWQAPRCPTMGDLIVYSGSKARFLDWPAIIPL
jgi:hypothetical protein